MSTGNKKIETVSDITLTIKQNKEGCFGGVPCGS